MERLIRPTAISPTLLLRTRTAALLACLMPACGFLGGCIPLRPRHARVVAERQELSDYKRAHYSAIPGRVLNYRHQHDLRQRLAQISVLFLGDIHDNQDLHTHLAAAIHMAQTSGRPTQILLECVGTQDEKHLRAFLRHEISLFDLCREVQNRWPESWLAQGPFDARFYRSLLANARDHESPILALEPTPRRQLAKRDPAMAKKIRQAHLNAPSSLLIVVVGHTHLLGQGHLVSRLQDLNCLSLLPLGGPSSAQGLKALTPYVALANDIWLICRD